jgi:hypothetical protein
MFFASLKPWDDDIEQDLGLGKATDGIGWLGKLIVGMRWMNGSSKSRAARAWMGRVSFAEGCLNDKASSQRAWLWRIECLQLSYSISNSGWGSFSALQEAINLGTGQIAGPNFYTWLSIATDSNRAFGPGTAQLYSSKPSRQETLDMLATQESDSAICSAFGALETKSVIPSGNLTDLTYMEKHHF